MFKIDYAIEDLRVMLGIRNYNYKTKDSFVSKIVSNSYDNTKGIEIPIEEITNAFTFKNIPNYLEKYVEK